MHAWLTIARVLVEIRRLQKKSVVRKHKGVISWSCKMLNSRRDQCQTVFIAVTQTGLIKREKKNHYSRKHMKQLTTRYSASTILVKMQRKKNHNNTADRRPARTCYAVCFPKMWRHGVPLQACTANQVTAVERDSQLAMNVRHGVFPEAVTSRDTAAGVYRQSALIRIR